jgi:hypothetical protein
MASYVHKPPEDRFGVHFQYQDLCARLKELELHQHPNTLKPRKQSHVSLKQRSLINAYTPTASFQKSIRLRLRGNRSITPSKLHCKPIPSGKTLFKPVFRGVKHMRQTSLPLLVRQKLALGKRKKSDVIYETMDW